MFGDNVQGNIEFFWQSENFQSKAELGYAGEIAVTQWLRGIMPEYDIKHVGTGYGCDIVATHKITGNRLPIEVKTANRGKDRKFRAILQKDGHTNTQEHSSVVIMLCLDPSLSYVVPFIIPVKELGNKRQLCITSSPLTYDGQYAQYRSNLSVLNQ